MYHREPDGPVRPSPWPAALLTTEDYAAIRAVVPEGHWVTLHGHPDGPFIAYLVNPTEGRVCRATSGLPVLAALRACGINA